LKGNARVFEGDVTVSKSLIALIRIPIEGSNLREQFFELFRHAVCSKTIAPISGWHTASRRLNRPYDLYIQLYGKINGSVDNRDKTR
jgi:hypothetical protein